MYQRSRKYQQHIAKHAREKADREKARRDGYHPDYPPELPELHRVILTTDYDTGTPITHQIQLYRIVWVDGRFWKERIDWSKILEGLTKA